MESVGSPEYKTQNEILSDELKSLFQRMLPMDLREAEAVDVVSVASGQFVQELAGVYSLIPGVREFRAVDRGIQEGLLTILNDQKSSYKGFRLENGDVSNADVLGQSRYDLAILRNPQIGSLTTPGEVNPEWKLIIQNTLDCVKPGGYLLISGHFPDEFERTMNFIKRTGVGCEILRQEDPITPSLKSGIPMKESSIALLRKPVAPMAIPTSR